MSLLRNQPNIFQRNWMVFPFVVAVVLWISWWMLLFFWSGKLEEKGQLGDLFGGVNALFTGLALAALAVSIVLQRREIRYQRKELFRTKKLAETQQQLQEATLRQNATIAMIAYYSKKLEIMEIRLKESRSPEMMTEFELAKEQFESLLSGLQSYTERDK